MYFNYYYLCSTLFLGLLRLNFFKIPPPPFFLSGYVYSYGIHGRRRGQMAGPAERARAGCRPGAADLPGRRAGARVPALPGHHPPGHQARELHRHRRMGAVPRGLG